MKTMNSAITEYSEALFSLSLEEGNQDGVLSDLECIGQVFEENPEYKEYVSCVSVPKEERVKNIEDTFSGKIEKYTLYSLCLLCEKNRIKEFFEFAKRFKELYEVSKKVSTALVTSAAPLTDGEKSAIKEKLEKLCGHSVELTCALDSSILGGFIAQVDEKIFDASLKSQLHGIKEVIDR